MKAAVLVGAGLAVSPPLLLSFLTACHTNQGDRLLNQHLQLAALVMLRPASGREVSGAEQITSENIAEYTPDPQAANQVMSFFRAKGFEVVPGAGPTFSIAGPKSLFEEAFGEPIKIEMKRDVVYSVTTEGGDLELPLELLPEDFSNIVQAVTFEAPPDFGPTEFQFFGT